jgi:hypothetical protein
MFRAVELPRTTSHAPSLLVLHLQSEHSDHHDRILDSDLVYPFHDGATLVVTMIAGGQCPGFGRLL